MNPVPCRLEPRFVPRIWGARSLAPLYPEKTNLFEPIGEVWLTGDDCTLANGPWAGKKLAAAWPEMPKFWAGSALNTKAAFPLLIKFLFPDQWLSVQVHPPDDYARQHEAAAGGVGKTEMWHAISAAPGASVLVGLKPDVDAATFRKSIDEKTVENCVERISIAAGDTIFVPAGTVHTIGPGMVLCEIQENSDITYRVYDYGRVQANGQPRELHIDRAMDVTRFGRQYGGKTRPQHSERSGRTVTLCAACPYFATEKWELLGRANRATTPERFELFIILEGSGRIEVPSQPAHTYSRADVWFMPAGLGAFQFTPIQPTTLLRTFVPDMPTLLQRFPDAANSQLVFP